MPLLQRPAICQSSRLLAVTNYVYVEPTPLPRRLVPSGHDQQPEKRCCPWYWRATKLVLLLEVDRYYYCFLCTNSTISVLLSFGVVSTYCPCSGLPCVAYDFRWFLANLHNTLTRANRLVYFLAIKLPTCQLSQVCFSFIFLGSSFFFGFVFLSFVVCFWVLLLLVMPWKTNGPS